MRNSLALLRRVMDSCYWGQDVSTRDIAPLALNNESILAVNAAGTGTVALIKADGSNTVTLPTGATVPVGQTLTVLGTLTSSGLNTTHTLATLTANGAVDPHTTANYVVTKAGVLADTLAAPTVTTDDGVVITITSSTNYAHTLTATGLLGTGTVKTDVATFAAYAGAGLTVMAYQGKWLVLASVGVTFS